MKVSLQICHILFSTLHLGKFIEVSEGRIKCECCSVFEIEDDFNGSYRMKLRTIVVMSKAQLSADIHDFAICEYPFVGHYQWANCRLTRHTTYDLHITQPWRTMNLYYILREF